VLAAESTLPPKAAVEEIIHRARESHDRSRQEARRGAEQRVRAAAEAAAELERLRREREALAHVRADEWGPFHGDRLWLGSLSGLLVLAVLVGLAVVIVTGHALATRPVLGFGVALCGTIAFLAGDWSARARTREASAAFFSLVALALLAVWGLAHTQHDGRTLEAVQLALLGAAAGAGVLTGRGRKLVPALREAEREHRAIRQIATAQERLDNAQAEVARYDFGIEAAPIASLTLRAVEEYLHKLDDARIQRGVFVETTHADLRACAKKLVAAWPTSLKS
jgi:hypothetical protein